MSTTDEEKKAAVPNPLVVFDLETTIARRGHPLQILEFGCMGVEPYGLSEVSTYSVLLKPSDPLAVTKKSIDINGITQTMLDHQRSFADAADDIYNCLHDKIVMGYNLKSFDIPHLKKAFDAIQHRAPVFAGVVDVYQIVRASPFNNRAKDNTLDSLSRYMGHGASKHRAVDDCRTTLAVLKTVYARLALERDMPDLFPVIQVAPKPPRRAALTELEKEMSELAVTTTTPEEPLPTFKTEKWQDYKDKVLRDH